MIKRHRVTRETDVTVNLLLGGSGSVQIQTGQGFFDHMVHQLAYHAGFDLELTARGDATGDHHLVEDVALTLGDALAEGWRAIEGFNRFGQSLLPMDDALVLCAVDLCGRPFSDVQLNLTRPSVGGLDTEMVPHFFSSLATKAEMNLHLRRLNGINHHHIVEAAFKSCGRALRDALGNHMVTHSTKGAL